MSFAIKRYGALGRVIVMALVTASLVSGCSTATDADAVADFLRDFAREVLAAWLL